MLNFTRYILPLDIQEKLDILSLNIKNKQELSRNLKLKDKHKGKRCFIIGNGPSIKDQDLTKLKNEFTFATNSFLYHPKYNQINPKFYCIADQEHFQNNATSRNWLKALEKKLSSNTTLIFSMYGKSLIESKKMFTKNNLYYFCQFGGFKENQKYNIELDRVIPLVSNVILGALIIAVYMGFKEIYLLGCDHSFFVHAGEADVKRFYKYNHHVFSNTKFTPNELRLKSVHRLYKEYRLLRQKLFTKIKIYNLTPTTYLDVFPLENFEQVIKQSGDQ